MIAKRIVEQALAEALKTGGDFAELFAQDKRSGVMLFQDGRVEDAVTGRMHGAGIRIKAGIASCIADFAYGIPGNFGNIHIGVRGNFPHHQHKAGIYRRLAGHPRLLILR